MPVADRVIKAIKRMCFTFIKVRLVRLNTIIRLPANYLSLFKQLAGIEDAN